MGSETGKARTIWKQVLIAVVLMVVVIGLGILSVSRSDSTASSSSTNSPAAAEDNSPKLTGIIYASDQTPVADAEVILAEGQRVQVYEQDPGGKVQVRSDAQGHYSLPMPKSQRYSIVVRAAEGFADVTGDTLKKSGPNIVLRAWASIDGIAMIGNKPAAGARIEMMRSQMSDGNSGRVDYQTTANCDANGHFNFPTLPPGEQMLGLSPGGRRSETEKWDYVVLDPGQALKMTLGGTGRPVIAHAPMPTTNPSLSWKSEEGSIVECYVMRAEPPTQSAPARKPDETLEQYEQESIAFGKTPAGRKWHLSSFQIYGKLDEDGTVHFNDLEAGQYQLQAHLMRDVTGMRFYEDVAQADKMFSVPEIPGGRSDEPLDIGQLNVKIISLLKPGDAAPPISVKTSDGSTWELSEHKGKPVVLFFWASFDPNRIKTMGKKIAEMVKDGRISAIGFNFDGSTGNALRKAATDAGMDFPQTSGNTSDVMNRYHATLVTAAVIDGQGRIVQRMLITKDALETYVQKAESAK
jgi:peroxiredoxin